MPKRMILYLLAIFYFFDLYAQAQESSREFEKIQKSEQTQYCDTLFDFFLQKKAYVTKQPLSQSLSENFPYNIIITVPNSTNKKKFVIAVRQEDIKEIKAEFLDLINFVFLKTKGNEPLFLLTANDISEQVPAIQQFSGSISFLQETDIAAAIFLFFDQKATQSIFSSNIRIIPAGNDNVDTSHIVSLPFLQSIVRGFENERISYSLEYYFLFFYRLGLVHSEPLVGKWLENGIPTVGLKVSSKNYQSVFKAISFISEHANFDVNAETDYHYEMVSIFSRTLWLQEDFFVFLLIGIAGLSLFLFWNLSFIKGVHKSIHKKEFAASWFLIPLIFIVTALSLRLSQSILHEFGQFTTDIPFVYILLKTFLTICFLSIFYFLQYIVNLPATGYIYGYLTSISAFLNIFIFASFEIVLVPFFILEYLIAHAFEKTRKIKNLILGIICMLIPYLPFVYTIAIRGDTMFAHNFFNQYNMSYAAILLPFQFILIRIFIRLKWWGKQRMQSLERIKLKIIIASSLILIVGLSLVIGKKIRPHMVTFSEAVNEVFTSTFKGKDSSDGDIAVVSILQKEHLNRNIITLHIKTSIPVIRHQLEVTSGNPLPILNANYPYDMLSKPFTALFPLENYPPNPLRLEFAIPKNRETTCTLKTWYKKNNIVSVQTQQFNIKSLDTTKTEPQK